MQNKIKTGRKLTQNLIKLKGAISMTTPKNQLERNIKFRIGETSQFTHAVWFLLGGEAEKRLAEGAKGGERDR